VLSGLLLGALLGPVTHGPRTVLLEGSAVTSAFALSALGSLFTGRPPMFHFAQVAMGGQLAASGQELDRRHRDIDVVRRYFRTVTLIWGATFLIEAAVKVIAVMIRAGCCS
jgi:hypothetical protein